MSKVNDYYIGLMEEEEENGVYHDPSHPMNNSWGRDDLDGILAQMKTPDSDLLGRVIETKHGKGVIISVGADEFHAEIYDIRLDQPIPGTKNDIYRTHLYSDLKFIDESIPPVIKDLKVTQDGNQVTITGMFNSKPINYIPLEIALSDLPELPQKSCDCGVEKTHGKMPLRSHSSWCSLKN